MDPKERFSDRAADYAQWRPGYPDEVVAALRLPSGARVADIGSGTGIAAELFARHGYEVVGVEPNAEMRARRWACPMRPRRLCSRATVRAMAARHARPEGQPLIGLSH